MKKFWMAALGVAVFALLFFSCTPSDDSDNPNVILDTEGVSIELKWSNSATNPAAETDFDLFIIDQADAQRVLESSSYGKFESIDLLPGTLVNGTYDIGVFIADLERQSNYQIIVTGKSTGKVWSSSYGPIYANDRFLTLKPVNMIVSGDKVTIN